MAETLGFFFLDTGAMYRTSALLAVRNSIPLSDTENIACCIREHSIEIVDNSIYLDNEDVSQLIRTPQISESASIIASAPQVRIEMVKLQRAHAEKQNTVAEGRDMGTVVFPRAHLKIMIIADIAVRVNRRWLELLNKGKHPDIDDILSSLLMRDYRDRNRIDSPLKAAPDAVIIDSSMMSISEQVQAVIRHYRERVC